MADNQFRARFSMPVGKDQSTNPGELAAIGDTIPIILNGWNAAGTEHLTQNLVLTYVSENGYEIGWEYDSTSQYVRPQDILAIGPGYQIECPAIQNIGLVATDDITETVTAFEVNGVETTGSWAVTEEGAAALELAIQTYLDENGIAGEVTVVYVNAGTDYLQVYVMQTYAEITLTPGGDLAPLV